MSVTLYGKCWVVILIAMCVLFADVHANTYVPWDELTEASWIDFGDVSAWPNMYPVNAGSPRDSLRRAEVSESYPVAFSPAGGDDKARGMNAIKFRHGGQATGHIVSSDQAGSFEIVNTGQNNTFTDVLLLVAINAGPGSLGDGFEMTLDPDTADEFRFDPDQFVFYDNPFGRPSGYYYSTDPADPHSTSPPGQWATEPGLVHQPDTAAVMASPMSMLSSVPAAERTRICFAPFRIR